ncbi:family 43 glycosylhydrolase [Armatimonas sp.]|uniref:family 43 glycosylhydrolase n=1 Tax=Armatimonas sp. TaxID=1872638 RepID=UPI003751998E
MPQKQTWRADNGNGTFSNPLFYDEFSDPDLIRVGSDFYLTGTTMHAMPGLPVLHSKDLVNWRFLSYACEQLDFGPEYRLEDGKAIYGQGIWAPSFRWHKGTFYIFTNVRGQPMQVYAATNPAGPWKHWAMKTGFHDPSVLFDDDGKIYVVYGYRDLRLVQLNSELTDAIAGTERTLFKPSDGMGEGAHFYKIRGKYFITSAWYMGTMKMPCARADRPEGPYEVLDISAGEDFGIANGAMHQGGIVETPTGEWWGFSMMDFNSLGRLTGLSPVTWKDGWPYFGLPGNLGRSPRTWVKPKTGATSKPSAPYERSDDFSGKTLKPIWQWNHAPDNTKWSLTERPGFLRLHALPAPDFWQARNTLTQRAIGPVSTPTAELDVSGMKPGDLAGLGLLNSPYAWIGVRCKASGFTVEQYDKATGKVALAPLRDTRIWLRAECDFLTEKAKFSFSTNGKSFEPLGSEFKMVFQLKTFQGVRYSLFHYSTSGAAGGHADFVRFTLDEPLSRGTKPIPYGKTITLTEVGSDRVLAVGTVTQFRVLDRGQGRIALQSVEGLVSVPTSDGSEPLVLKMGRISDAETSQWIETPRGELTLLSLTTQRYLRLAPDSGKLLADSTGGKRNQPDGSRFRWRTVTA